MISRHLLALFALFSGFAVLHAPAQASAAQSVVQDARAVASAGECSASESCACAERARERAAKHPRRQAKQTLTWLPRWLRPPFVFGSERALE